MLNIEEKEKYN
jgi:hypothetical protein